MKKALIGGLLILMTGWHVPAKAQLHLYLDGEPLPGMMSLITYSISDTSGMQSCSPPQVPGKAWMPADVTLTKRGIHEQTLWIRIPLSAIPKGRKVDVIAIENPHINYLRCWVFKGDSMLKATNLTGDHRPFYTREIHIGDFTCYLPRGYPLTDLQLVCAIDKRKTKLDIPFHFFSNEAFTVRQRSLGFSSGLLLGCIILLLIIQLFLLLTTADRAHAWYSLHLIFMVTYLMADQGLLFKYLFPKTPGFNDLVRPALLSLSLIPVMLFYRSILRLDRTMPRHDNALKWLLGAFFFLFITAFTSMTGDDYEAHSRWLNLVYLVSPGILLYFFWITIWATRNNISLAGYACASLAAMTTCVIIYSLTQLDGLPSDVPLFNHAQYAGMVLDGIIMTFALIARYLSFRLQNRQLRQQIQEQQEHIFREVAEWQHREMNRIAGYLHDSLGSSLALIRMENDYMNLTEQNRQQLSGKIQELGNDIRQMSHTFSVKLLEQKGVKATLEEVIQRLNRQQSADIQLEWIGNDNSIRFHYQMVIFRIVQELLRNLIKHAHAKRANLQILTVEQRVYVYMEDDGIGASTTNNGIGLKHIEGLVGFLQGSLRIDTAPGQGFNISIEFNQADHE